jgi:pimeloyl-ACP methyl ester carboxylesterase
MSVHATDDSRVPVSDELFAPLTTGVVLCYQTFGDPAGDPLVLVMGLGGPMIWWDDELCVALAERGFHVIRYDNRDTGRSSRIHQRVTRAQIVHAFAGRPVRPPYTLDDLAADAVALLDHLGIESAHVAGVSMGGMIAQTLAIGHPQRVRSLTSIMSSTGRRTVGWQHPRLLPALVTRRAASREAYVATSAAYWKLIGSPDYPDTPEKRANRAGDTWDRGFDAGGVLRHTLTVLTQPNRTLALRSLRIPVTIVHGLADPLVHPSGGRATARAIPGAELLLIEGMGHDLPAALFDTFADVIRRTADRA